METRVVYLLPPRTILQSSATSSGFPQIHSQVFFQVQPSIRHQYSVTNRGVNICLPARRIPGNYYQVALSCCHQQTPNSHPIGLRLHQVKGQTEQFLRSQPSILDDAVEISPEFTFQELYVQHYS